MIIKINGVAILQTFHINYYIMGDTWNIKISSRQKQKLVLLIDKKVTYSDISLGVSINILIWKYCCH